MQGGEKKNGPPHKKKKRKGSIGISKEKDIEELKGERKSTLRGHKRGTLSKVKVTLTKQNKKQVNAQRSCQKDPEEAFKTDGDSGGHIVRRQKITQGHVQEVCLSI